MFDKIMEKACDSLESIERSGNFNLMNKADREIISELVDLKKNILKVEKLEDEVGGYSEGGDWEAVMRGERNMMSRRGSYDHNDGVSYRRHRDRLGRYSSAGDMMAMVEDMIASAPDERHREAAKKFKEKLEMM